MPFKTERLFSVCLLLDFSANTWHFGAGFVSVLQTDVGADIHTQGDAHSQHSQQNASNGTLDETTDISSFNPVNLEGAATSVPS